MKACFPRINQNLIDCMENRLFCRLKDSDRASLVFNKLTGKRLYPSFFINRDAERIHPS